MQYKENGSAPLLSETPMRLLLPPVRPCVPPWRQDGIRKPGGAEQGRVGAVSPALARCPGSHPRPVCATSPERFAPPIREKWTVEKSAGKPYHISSQCGERLCRQYLHGRGTRFYPPTGGASRAFGLPLAAKRVLRAGARTHFRRPEGRRSERRNRALPGHGLSAACWILIRR